MVLIAAGVLLVLGIAAVLVLVVKRTAYLGPVKEELQKEKAWLRRGEYNAAMVKGRQNLELLLKLVAEKNGIQLDNTVQAQANARELEERQSRNPRGGKKQKTKSVMTHKEFNRWLTENGYLDRVARWEMHQVRQIGNKAVHENYADKEDAWNQFNYLEDILKVVTEKSQSPGKRTERNAERKGAAAAKKTEQPKVKKEAPKKAEQPKVKKETPKKSEQPKVKKETPKKSEPPKTKPAPEAVFAEQAAAEPEKKKRRRHRPKKKAPVEGSAVEVKSEQPKAKKETPKKAEQPKVKKETPKKPEQPKAKPEQPKATEQPKAKKKNSNQYWQKRRKKKASGQAQKPVPEGRNENI